MSPEQLHRHGVGQSDRVGGTEQRRADFAGANFGVHTVTRCRACGNETVGPAVDAEQRPALRQIAQREQPAVVVGFDPHRLAWHQLIKGARTRVGAQELLRSSVGNLQTGEHAAQGVAALDSRFAPVAVADRRRRQRRQRQIANDPPRGHVRVRHPRDEAEGSDTADDHHDEHCRDAACTRPLR